MIVEKLKELPLQLQIEGVWFDFKLQHDTPTSLLLSYEVVSADQDSPHLISVAHYGCWKNRYADNETSGYLWYRDTIETDEDLLNAVDECKMFLTKYNLYEFKRTST